MILIILVLVVLTSFIYYWKVFYHPDDDGMFIVFCTIMVSVTVFALFWVLTPTSDTIEGEAVPLKALGTSSEISGSFFLGSGYVDSEQHISYISMNEDSGAVSLKSVKARDAFIYEDDSATPHMVTIGYEKNYWWLSPFSLYGGGTDYKFVVPSGSVSNEFDVSP